MEVSITKTFVIDGNDFIGYDRAYFKIVEIITEGKNSNIDFLPLSEMVKKYLSPYRKDIKIIWKNSEKSKSEMGYESLVINLRRKLQRAPISNVGFILEDIKKAENKEGPILFDNVIEAFTSNNINIVLQ